MSGHYVLRVRDLRLPQAAPLWAGRDPNSSASISSPQPTIVGLRAWATREEAVRMASLWATLSGAMSSAAVSYEVVELVRRSPLRSDAVGERRPRVP